MLNSSQLFELPERGMAKNIQFRQLVGKPQLITCSGCLKERTGGSPDERSASGRILDVVYLDITSNEPVFYCEACAAKHVEGIDPTRSVTQFYADTHGEYILV